MSDKISLPRTLTGVVTSDKREQTIAVLIERRVRHPKYQKIIRRTTKVHAHNPDNLARQGDIVVIRECRPISKTKTWILESIKEKAESAEGNG
ncbi:MAG: 30S ribosomal protein S17 [Proteobacteria bacterium]|nr:30S ribosomal protein S17 [Pseudomonadota bacterium]